MEHLPGGRSHPIATRTRTKQDEHVDRNRHIRTSEHSRNGLRFLLLVVGKVVDCRLHRKPSRSAIPRRGQAVSACPTQQRHSDRSLQRTLSCSPHRDLFRLGWSLPLRAWFAAVVASRALSQAQQAKRCALRRMNRKRERSDWLRSLSSSSFVIFLIVRTGH